MAGSGEGREVAIPHHGSQMMACRYIPPLIVPCARPHLLRRASSLFTTTRTIPTGGWSSSPERRSTSPAQADPAVPCLGSSPVSFACPSISCPSFRTQVPSLVFACVLLVTNPCSWQGCSLALLLAAMLQGRSPHDLRLPPFLTIRLLHSARPPLTCTRIGTTHALHRVSWACIKAASRAGTV